jgi:hypothetical protein
MRAHHRDRVEHAFRSLCQVHWHPSDPLRRHLLHVAAICETVLLDNAPLAD